MGLAGAELHTGEEEEAGAATGWGEAKGGRRPYGVAGVGAYFVPCLVWAKHILS
jgi:hypothetical protein